MMNPEILVVLQDCEVVSKMFFNSQITNKPFCSLCMLWSSEQNKLFVYPKVPQTCVCLLEKSRSLVNMSKTTRREIVVFLLKQLNSLQIRSTDPSAAEFPMKFKSWLIYRYNWHLQLRLQSPRS